LAQLAKALVLIRCLRDPGFETRFKSSQSLLVVGMDVVDFNNGKPFIRPLKPEDYVESHSRILRWQFDPLEAQKYRDDVKQYFNRVFPLQDELDVYLKFMAMILNGSPCKAFGLGVDDSSLGGDNGKTTLIEFNSETLRALEKQNGWLVCSKQEVQSMDRHNAGLKQLEYVRLLQIDELGKGMKWNDGAFTKWLCGGSRAVANGRGFRSGKDFEFQIMTKVFITANMDSIPDCSNLDPAFIRRMLVFPFRSKFGEEEDAGKFLFKKQIDLSKKFILWRSAYLQLLMDSYDANFDPKQVPQSMLDWKTKVLAPKDTSYEALVKKLQRCGCDVDHCKIHILQVGQYLHSSIGCKAC
jgi:phage/plasmid-associated DNA primase